MSTITQQIDRILDMRLGRGEYEGAGMLQTVNSEIEKLMNLRDAVVNFQQCSHLINVQINNQKGEFYRSLHADPDAMAAFNQIDYITAIQKIDTAIDNLTLLQKRFERESVRIAFIGFERQGKSTFLQSMTGLPNEVIPAYDGTSCTGAVSVIHNRKTKTPFRAEIEFYTVPEFLNNVKAKLEMLIPSQKFYLNSLEDLSTIDMSAYTGTDKTEIEKLIKNNIIEHRHLYGPFLGRGVIEYTDKDEVMKFVAQYREYTDKTEIPTIANPNDIKERVKEQNPDGSPKEIVWRHMYYWYLAVKSVNIYCEFPNQDCGRIEFVDTVGLGPSVNADAVEKEMFRVLREDCDGAIDVFCPANTGGSVPEREERIFNKLIENLSVRNPQKWISYAINSIPYGPKCNIQNLQDIKDDLALKQLPFGFYEAVNAADRDEVSNKLLIPHLQMIANNLEYLDNNLRENADIVITETVNCCQRLIKTASKVIPMSAITDWKFERDGYEPMLKALNVAMNDLDHDGYAQKKDTECPELTSAYEQLLGNIDKDLPTEKELLFRIKSGNFVTPQGLFEEAIEQIRNGILEVFEELNHTVIHPLQEKVKLDIIEILYHQGKMSLLPLPKEYANIGPSVKWLEAVICNYIPQEKYPALYEALRYVLDYEINIEGTAEYYVIESLYIIEKDHKDFIPYAGGNPHDFSDKAACVWQELANRLIPLQKRLRNWMGKFSLQPSLLSYSRVHKFHVKIGTNVNGVRDLKEFYNDNMGLIWRSEIEGKAHENVAFAEWTECINSMRNAIEKLNN